MRCGCRKLTERIETSKHKEVDVRIGGTVKALVLEEAIQPPEVKLCRGRRLPHTVAGEKVGGLGIAPLAGSSLVVSSSSTRVVCEAIAPSMKHGRIRPILRPNSRIQPVSAERENLSSLLSLA